MIKSFILIPKEVQISYFLRLNVTNSTKDNFVSLAAATKATTAFSVLFICKTQSSGLQLRKESSLIQNSKNRLNHKPGCTRIV